MLLLVKLQAEIITLRILTGKRDETYTDIKWELYSEETPIRKQLHLRSIPCSLNKFSTLYSTLKFHLNEFQVLRSKLTMLNIFEK